MMIVSSILHYSRLFPEKPALITDVGTTITYGQLVSNIGRACFFLQSKGVLPGSNVLLSATKEPEFVFFYLATHLLKGRAVIVDPESNKQRLDYIINKVDPVLILGFDKDLVSLYHQFEGVRDEVDVEALATGINGEDICDILFTTGTTGAPKGVLLTQNNILNATININTFIGTDEDDLEVLALPLCHSFGLGRLRCVLSMGATLVLLGSFANLKHFFECLKTYKATGFGMVPSVWNYIKRLSGDRITQYASHLRYIEIGSAPMDVEDKRYLCKLFPDTRICMHYGLTEASRSSFIEFHRDCLHLDSIGLPSPNVQVKFFSGDGRMLPFGEEGELCIAGKHVMRSYLLKDDNPNAFYGDYFRTGDWGMMDENGFLYLLGRKKELINTGGKKVAPIEVESCINQMDGVLDCICIGIPDPNKILGEVIKCFVKPENGASFLNAASIKEHVRKELESYKVPFYVEFVEELPITKSGKKQRLLLQ